LTEALLESGFEVTGIDISSELLALGFEKPCR
jgi:2-polyprenyl-3-methyl-5-hydroxy-6-metoxy-1,4-benzoquinol methylase